MNGPNSQLPCVQCDGVTGHLPYCIGVMLDEALAEVERLREALEVLVAEIEAEHDEYEERHGERPQMRALQQACAALALSEVRR